jgi:hypothetical protein
MEPSVARFIARHHVSRRQEVEDDVAEYRDRTPAERLADVVVLCELAATLLASRPDRDRVVGDVEPPHPTYRAIIDRLRAR